MPEAAAHAESPKSTKRSREGVSVRVLHLRVKDKHTKFLRQCAFEVNQVFNFVNELGMKILDREGKWAGGFDYWPYLQGITTASVMDSAAFSLPVQTVQEVAEEQARRRRQFGKRRLRWRKSGGARRSLGWVPFKVKTLQLEHGQVRFAGRWLSLFDSYNLDGVAKGAMELRAGSFAEDSRGRWFLNVAIEVPNRTTFVGPMPERNPTMDEALGIDLGLKYLATLSDGRKIEAQRFYRDLEPDLAVAQRANKKDRVRAIHAKIANRRKDHLHKLSTALVKDHRRIFVGNVNAAGLAKTNMAKSVLDAGWSMFRTQMQYKGDHAGILVREVNEAYSTQACHACLQLTGPKGKDGLAVRRWICAACWTEHDRDVNAAKNIRRGGILDLLLGQNEETPGPKKTARKSRKNRASNKVEPSSVGVGHDPLAEGIPFQ